MTALRYVSLTASKRSVIFFSAMKALMIRSPPSVSSSCDSMLPHSLCAVVPCALRRLLTCPIIMPAIGATTMTNRVSCQLTNIMVAKHIMIAIGWRISMSIELVREVSTCPTSELMRAMMSPLRSEEKKANGSDSTLRYSSIRMSFTMPVRSGSMTKSEAKYPRVLSRVMTTRPPPMMHSVTNAPC